MTTISADRARKIGGRNAVKGFGWMFLLAEGLIFFFAKRNDVGNGLLYFLDGQKDPFFIGVSIVLCSSFFLLGRIAGRQILVGRRNLFIIALINTACSVLGAIGYMLICARVLHLDHLKGWPGVFTALGIFSGCGWLIGVWYIRQEGRN